MKHGPDPDSVDEPTDGAESVPPRRRRRGSAQLLIQGHAMDVVDVFVYVVVLNLAVEYFPTVLTESFTLSLLTAFLLKVVLEVVLLLEHAAHTRYKRAPTWWSKALGGVLLVLVAVGSKLTLLALVHLIFGGDVSLGSFWSVTTLVIILLLSRAAVRNLLFWEQTHNDHPRHPPGDAQDPV